MGRGAFAALFGRGAAGTVRKQAGPLGVSVRPSGLAEHRLGLSVGRRVGGAVERNAVKRRLREAFRQVRAELPMPAEGAYDVGVAVRPHDRKKPAEYAELISSAVGRAHRELCKRAEAAGGGPGDV